MLTGDNEALLAVVAEVVKVDLWNAGLLPEDKVRIVEQLSKELPKGQRFGVRGRWHKTTLPVLMRADVGFAMGALGSDAAIEAADVVLMDDKVNGNRLSDTCRQTYTVGGHAKYSLALLVKFAFLALGAVGFRYHVGSGHRGCWVSLLAVLNSTRTLRLFATKSVMDQSNA
jgi:Cd2+/Zn2+-exporting ATPase